MMALSRDASATRRRVEKLIAPRHRQRLLLIVV
jgi:hypothetical protein